MQEILVKKLYGYIVQNNPDLLIELQDKASVTKYLEDRMQLVETVVPQMLKDNKPVYLVEDHCMDILTADLRPSKYNYLLAVLMDEFETHYEKLLEEGTLTYEIINLIAYCKPVFETMGFTVENEGDKQLRLAVTGQVHAYLHEN